MEGEPVPGTSRDLLPEQRAGTRRFTELEPQVTGEYQNPEPRNQEQDNMIVETIHQNYDMVIAEHENTTILFKSIKQMIFKIQKP